MKDIEIAKNKLPDNVQDLTKFLLVGKEALKSYQAKVKAIEKLGLAKAVKDQALEDGQRVGSAILYAEVKLGEILKKASGSTAGTTKTLPEGITKKQSHFAQKLASNINLIEQEIEDARKYEDIPTRRGVFRKIQEREKEIRDKKFKSKPLPKNIFNVIYADPPWQFANAGLSESADSYYKTMPTEEICNMNVKSLCCGNTVLFLWATNAMLEDALEVIKRWGFKYKSNIVWVKDKGPSIGWFVKSKHELLLIATRENNNHPKQKPSSWINLKPSKHSKKPDFFNDLIMSMYDGPYLELFARNKKDKWEAWGNEIPEN